MRLLTLVLLYMVLLSAPVAAAGNGAAADTTATATKRATIAADTAVSAPDSTSMTQPAAVDTNVVRAAAMPQDSASARAAGAPARPAVAAPADRASTRKIKLVKREYNHRQQIILAVGMMAFIAIMMTTAQSMNPK
jgi:hypothetical protein